MSDASASMSPPPAGSAPVRDTGEGGSPAPAAEVARRGVFRRALALVPGAVRWEVVGTGMLNLGGAALAVGSTAVTGLVVDAAADGDRAGLPRRLGLLLLLTVVASALVWLSRTTLVRAGERVLAALRDRATASVGAAPLRFLERHRDGELHRRLTGEISGLAAFAGGTLPDLVSAAAVLGLTVALLLAACWPLALALLAVFVPLAFVVVRTFHHRAGPAYARLAEAEADVAATFGESLPAREQLWASGSVPRWLARFGRDNERLLAARGVQVRAELVLNRLALVQAGALAVLVVLGAFLVGRDLLSAGTAVVFVLATRDLLLRFEELVGAVGDAREAHVRLGRLLDLIDAAEPVSGPVWDPVALPVRGDLCAQGVRFGYLPGGRAVLDGFSLTVPAGDRLAVVGETGSGKSTLGKLLAGLYAPDRGRVTYAGHDLAALDPVALRERIVLVPQEVALVRGTLVENLAPGAGGTDRGRVAAGVARLGLSAWVAGLPAGLDTPVTDRSLSAGERQLVAIVRAFLTDPAVLILDEATAGVDHGTAARIEEALAAAAEDRTLIVVAHRADTIGRARRRLGMPGGTLLDA
ncbi:ABC transporter ATP-binding protein [Streptomyces sp. NPDC048182]|uniref:ABC transporter ATP-binding protein n=1 Tax=Streptomyces sp. NPDC048182 TaxID=3365507 RepID=UPI003713E10A